MLAQRDGRGENKLFILIFFAIKPKLLFSANVSVQGLEEKKGGRLYYSRTIICNNPTVNTGRIDYLY